MSFVAPAVLVGLLALPLLVVAYGRAQRTRVRQAAAFAEPRMRPSFAPNGPRWRRHAPFAVFALATAVLVAAAARPETTVSVAVDHAAIMLATDVSASMRATDVAPSRLAAAQKAGARFAGSVPGQVNVGALEFNQRAALLQSPTTDRAALRAALGRMQVSGGTAIGDAIEAALRVLTPTSKKAHPPPAAIVLLSDGYSTSGTDPIAAARQARARHVPIYTVSLGTPNGTIRAPARNGGVVTTKVPPSPQALSQIAAASGGHAFTARNASSLSAVYKHLGAQLSHRNVKREVTAGFAGAGLALLLLGVALSLHWFGRLV